ncbi:MAG: hypothetical protein Q8P41_13050 [Pseudomonadota bacterium]|nr:hypothetical protein [Pseudomonadota bacterium]
MTSTASAAAMRSISIASSPRSAAYTDRQDIRLSRAEFEANLLAKLGNRDVRTDMVVLLAPGFSYDIDEAAAWVATEVLPRLQWNRGFDNPSSRKLKKARLS